MSNDERKREVLEVNDMTNRINKKVIPERKNQRKLRKVQQRLKRDKEFLKTHGYLKEGHGTLDMI